jgi:nucleoside-diphosphate-sugar epimerase
LSLLVRKDSRRGAREWLADLRLGEPDVARRIRLLTGDLTRPEILDPRDRSSLLDGIEIVVHAAAVTGPKVDRAWAWSHNVRGTTHLLNLAGDLTGLRRFVHLSDALAVAGDHRGPFSESDLLRGQRFSTPYGETKLVAERRVRGSSLPWTILRPGAVRRDWLVEAVAALSIHPDALQTCVHLVDPDQPGGSVVFDTRNATRLLRPLGLELLEYGPERGV